MEDPIIADNTTMTGAERRLSIQLYCVLALTCRKRALQAVQQVPRGYGFEAWRMLCKETWTASSGEIPWSAPSPLVVDEISRVEAVGLSVEEQRKGLQGTVGQRGVSLTGSQQDQRRRIVLVKRRPRSSEQDKRVRYLEARTHGTWCRWAAEKWMSQRNRRSASTG